MKTENKTMDITPDSSQYNFTAETSNKFTNRFKIVTIPVEKETLKAASDIKIFNSKNTVFVTNRSNQKGEMVIYDISGRILKRATFDALGVTVIPLDDMKGVCVVNATTCNERVSERVILGEL